ncbi:CLUMA_CG009200, isoform A [Clunio marinus]|uniref:CLUMA_CG009200, isoform A n=1 Tax=Clunio marinus TaxID=568069 RepID=A0A1J1I5Z1_9DIPT|nr:CLUMA_CG009200, isoform A [Clunio marinus]
MAQKPASIFINPKFKNAHINPNFLSRSKIHFNPKFLTNTLVDNSLFISESIPKESALQPKINNGIIKQTRRSLIRDPNTSRSNVLSTSEPNNSNFKASFKNQNLIKINRNKLVKATQLMQHQHKENEVIKKKTQLIQKTKSLLKQNEHKSSIYKLDRRKDLTPKIKKIVSTYSLRQVDAISPKKAFAHEKVLRISKLLSKTDGYKNTVMIDINGVHYKSTSKTLTKTLVPFADEKRNSNEKMLIIRGEKFILDTSGRKLKRSSEGNDFKMSRIDIGGLTYKASESGAYERDNSHQIRNHLSFARMKSISFLARNRLQKSNIICPIYRRLGKCLSYANGRCQKVHDQRYVIVCPKYLTGSCQDDKCMLSHNANLHKMPVCKFFLQGLCQKQRNCLYLHKKLTEDTKLCNEFLKGYCPKADKCTLLHDFMETHKKKILVNNGNSKKKLISEKGAERNFSKHSRYQIDESQESTSRNVPKREKLGSLPAFIPL